MKNKNYTLIRSSNIELLRIISMLLIITTHIFGHYVPMTGSCWPLPNGHVFYFTLKSISYIAVNIYVLISAYFLSQSVFKSKRVIYIWAQVLFYSIVLFFLHFILTGNLAGILYSFFPILTNSYWFATVFIGLLILSPFLNLIISKFSERQLRFLCIILLFLFSIIPQLVYPMSEWLNFGGGTGIVWFIVLYFWGGYIRLYVSHDFIVKNKKWLLSLGLLASVLPALLRYVIIYVTKNFIGYPVAGGFFYGNNMLFPVLASVLIFIFFLQVNITQGCIANLINK